MRSIEANEASEQLRKNYDQLEDLLREAKDALLLAEPYCCGLACNAVRKVLAKWRLINV